MTRGHDGAVDRRGTLGAGVAAFTITGLVLLIGAGWLAGYLHNGDRAPRNAQVEGVSIAGLEPVAAQEKLSRALQARVARPITVSYGDGRTRSVDPAAAGLRIDVAASVEAASGGAGWSPRRLYELASGSGDHRAVVTIDEQKMQTTLDALAQGIARPPVDGTLAFRDGRAVGVPGRPGQVIDRSAARAMLMQRFLRQGTQKLPVRQQAPTVTADEVNRVLGSFGRPAMSAPVTLVLAGRRVVAPPRLFDRALSVDAQNGVLVPQVDPDVLMTAIAPVMGTLAAEAQDARLEMRDGRPLVVPARVGVTVDPTVLQQGFETALSRHGADRRAVVPGRVQQPATTTTAIEALKVRQRVSSFTARFPYADYRNTNLARATALLDGRLLRPGQTFSLNGVLGARTSDNGFTEGYVVTDGVFGKDAGGGLAPLSTAVFNAMFFAGLEDVSHTATRQHTEGNPAGLETDLAWPATDLQFADDSPYGVLISARMTPSAPGRPGSVTVEMWSTKRWGVTARTGPRTAVLRPTVRYVADQPCQPVTGSAGFGVDVTRVFRRPGRGTVVRSDVFHTDYQPGDTVRCGQAPRQR